jgi:hypothetical protein
MKWSSYSSLTTDVDSNSIMPLRAIASNAAYNVPWSETKPPHGQLSVHSRAFDAPLHVGTTVSVSPNFNIDPAVSN